MKRVEFEGIPSGDCECFCWDVDHETFVRLTGREPDEYEGSKFNEGKYRLYPNELWPFEKKPTKWALEFDEPKEG